jgi:hypothetical protein
MNGTDHYREAQRLLEAGGSGETAEDAANRLAEAQVHATLALVAATVAAQSDSTDDRSAWHAATGEQPRH